MDFDALYLRVLKFLNFRPRSEKEVREYIQKIVKHSGRQNASNSSSSFPRKRESKGWIPDQVGDDTDSGLADLIIHKLKQQKFLNDVEFARWLIRSRTAFKPKGKYIVQQELQQKGISKEIVDEVLAQERDQSEEDLAMEVLLGKKRKYEDMEPQERFRKAGSMLARRGFSLDAIKTAIDRVFGKMV